MIVEECEALYLAKIRLKCPIEEFRLESLAFDECFEPCVLDAVEHILNEEKTLPQNILMAFLSMLRWAEKSDRMLSMVAIQNGTHGEVYLDFATQFVSFGVTRLNCNTLLDNIYSLKHSIYIIFIVARLWELCPDRKEDLIAVLRTFYPDNEEVRRLISTDGLKCGDKKVQKSLRLFKKQINLYTQS